MTKVSADSGRAGARAVASRDLLDPFSLRHGLFGRIPMSSREKWSTARPGVATCLHLDRPACHPAALNTSGTATHAVTLPLRIHVRYDERRTLRRSNISGSKNCDCGSIWLSKCSIPIWRRPQRCPDVHGVAQLRAALQRRAERLSRTQRRPFRDRQGAIVHHWWPAHPNVSAVGQDGHSADVRRRTGDRGYPRRP